MIPDPLLRSDLWWLLGETAIHSAWIGAVIVLPFLFLARRLPSHRRADLWALALGAQLMVPIAVGLVLAAASGRSSPGVSHPSWIPLAPITGTGTDLRAWVPAIWALGTILGLVRLSLDIRATARLRRDAQGRPCSRIS